MSVTAAKLLPSAINEINALLIEPGTSGCQFYRNGKWYGADKAQDHMQRKLKSLVKHGLVSSPEEFIEMGATRSSNSGKAYKVQCHGQKEEPSAVWLTNKLRQMRQRRANELMHSRTAVLKSDSVI